MKDNKSGRKKKYIHEIKIVFKPDEETDINQLCNEVCQKEQIYLNPSYVRK